MDFTASDRPMKNILWLQWIAGTGAMLIMLTLGLMIGWTSPYLAQLTSHRSQFFITSNEASWVASLFNFGQFSGAIVGGICVQYFGSKQTLIVTGFPMILSWICIIFSDSVSWLYVARIAGGLSSGMSFSSFPLFLGEISSPEIRGALVSFASTGPACGTLLGNFMGAYVSMSTFSYISFVPNVAFILLFMWLPQSPHHLVRRDRIEDAKKSIARYNPNVDPTIEVQALKDFVSTSEKLTVIAQLREFNIPRNRKAGVISILLYFFSQFSGMTAVLFYMEIILTAGKFTIIVPATAVILVGVVGVTSGCISVVVADKFRRKVLMIVSSAGACVSMTALGAHFTLLDYGVDPEWLQWLPITSIFVFIISVCNGLIAVPNMILSELFAPNIKSLAACIASIAFGMFSFASTKSYQPLVNLIGMTFVFWTYAVLMILSIVFSAVFLPETKGKSLQEIQDALMSK